MSLGCKHVGLLLCCDRHVFAGSRSDDQEAAESMAEDLAAFTDEGTSLL